MPEKKEVQEVAKKKYYEVVVQNNDVSDGEYNDIMFHANDKLVHIKPGKKVIISQTAYENLTQRCIQTRRRPNSDKMSDSPLETYEHHRYPVVTLREMELTEDEYVKEVAKLRKAG